MEAFGWDYLKTNFCGCIKLVLGKRCIYLKCKLTAKEKMFQCNLTKYIIEI